MTQKRPSSFSSGATFQARHYQTGKAVECSHAGGRWTRILEISEPLNEAGLPWIAPGLLDVQVNGFAGVDFQKDSLALEELRAAVEGLIKAGCTGCCPTLITASWPKMMERLRRLRALKSQDPLLQDFLVGWHLEGPFLSDRPGFAGAHDPSVMENPRVEHLRQILEITGEDPVLLTLAPERHGAIEVIREAVRMGIRVSLGHADPSAAMLREARDAGAIGFTHLGNGCPRELDRHDNILWRVLDVGSFHVGLIPDGIHVSPSLFRLLHRLLAPSRIYYTSDAMAAAGAPPGIYSLAGLQLEVGEDRVVRKPGSSLFAGSAVTPLEAVFRAAAMLGVSWRETWSTLSQTPAQLMGLQRGISPGMPADFCLLKFDDKGGLESLEVRNGGDLLFSGTPAPVLIPEELIHHES